MSPKKPQTPKVVAIGNPTTEAHRQRLSTLLGEEFALFDIRSAPNSADVILIEPCSPQAVRGLCRQFPQARLIVIQTIDKPHRPDICRCLSAGATAHLHIRDIVDMADT